MGAGVRFLPGRSMRGAAPVFDAIQDAGEIVFGGVAGEGEERTLAGRLRGRVEMPATTIGPRTARMVRCSAILTTTPARTRPTKSIVIAWPGSPKASDA
jgi:hypothetical protein